MSENDPQIHDDSAQTHQPVVQQAPEGKRVDDAANQSLADALSVSFGMLKFVMVLLVVIYLASGMYSVDTQERAVELRFGEIVGEGTEGLVKYPGWHFGFPQPMGNVVRVPIAAETVSLEDAFMYSMTDAERRQTHAERSKMARVAPLNPLNDGSLITSDTNIVHLDSVSFNFQVKDDSAAIKAFVENVGDMDNARAIVTAAAERGLIHAVASMELDQIRAQENFLRERAKMRTQEILDEMDTGLVIIGTFNLQSLVPKPVNEAYSAVTRAESERLQLIDEAKKESNSILGNVAGSASKKLIEIINAYELAANSGDKDEMARLDAVLAEAFDNLRMPEEYGGDEIGGKVAEVIQQAVSYRTQEVESVKAETSRFATLLPQYKKNPLIVMTRLRQQTLRDIFTEDSEVLFLSTDNLEIVTNRNPEITKQRQEEALKAAREKKAQEAAAANNQ